MQAAANYTGPIDVGMTFNLRTAAHRIVTVHDVTRHESANFSDLVRVRGDGIDLCFTEGVFRQIAEHRPHATRVSSFEVDPGFFVDWLLSDQRVTLNRVRVHDQGFGGHDRLVFSIEHSNKAIPAGHVSLEFESFTTVGHGRASRFSRARSIPAPVYRRPDHPVDYLEKALGGRGVLDEQTKTFLSNMRRYLDEPITEEQAAAERPGLRYSGSLELGTDAPARPFFVERELTGDGSGEALPPMIDHAEHCDVTRLDRAAACTCRNETALLDRDIAAACPHPHLIAIDVGDETARCDACGTELPIVWSDRDYFVLARAPKSEVTINAAIADAKKIHHAIAQTPQTPPRR